MISLVVTLFIKKKKETQIVTVKLIKAVYFYFKNWSYKEVENESVSLVNQWLKLKRGWFPFIYVCMFVYIHIYTHR